VRESERVIRQREGERAHERVREKGGERERGKYEREEKRALARVG